MQTVKRKLATLPRALQQQHHFIWNTPVGSENTMDGVLSMNDCLHAFIHHFPFHRMLFIRLLGPVYAIATVVVLYCSHNCAGLSKNATGPPDVCWRLLMNILQVIDFIIFALQIWHTF